MPLLSSLPSPLRRFQIPYLIHLIPTPHPPPTPALDERPPEYHHLLYLYPLGAPRCPPDLGRLTRPRFTPAPAAGTRLASGSGGRRRGKREDSIGGYWLGAVAVHSRPSRVVSTALSLSLSLSLCVCVCVSVSVSLPRLLALSLSGFVSYLSPTPSSLVSFFLSIGEHGRAEGPERGQSKVGKIRQSASNTALHYLNAFGTLPAHCPTPTLCYTMLAVWRPPGPTGRLLPLPDSVLQ